MNKFNWVLIVYILLLPISISAIKSEINYTHKSLKKEIEKNWNSDINALIEIQVGSNLPFQGKFFKISETSNSFVYVGRVNSCRAGGCSINSDSYGPSEYFDYYIFFDDIGAVKLMKIYNYAASHGHEVMAKGWLKQFRGYDTKTKLEVGKNIDSISGATISVNAITNDVKEKTNLLLNYLNKL